MQDQQRDKKNIISYPPTALRDFAVLMYEWIDNLCFTIDPSECLSNSGEYIQIARELFLEAGWGGDGRIEFIWVPPFVLDWLGTFNSTHGVTVRHVKQKSDGISWILHPPDMFDRIKRNMV
jgi:hypothetical protein